MQTKRWRHHLIIALYITQQQRALKKLQVWIRWFVHTVILCGCLLYNKMKFRSSSHNFRDPCINWSSVFCRASSNLAGIIASGEHLFRIFGFATSSLHYKMPISIWRRWHNWNGEHCGLLTLVYLGSTQIICLNYEQAADVCGLRNVQKWVSWPGPRWAEEAILHLPLLTPLASWAQRLQRRRSAVPIIQYSTIATTN